MSTSLPTWLRSAPLPVCIASSSTFRAPRRLRSFTAGAEADGYTNKNLTSISVGANTLLEYLDLRGTPELKQALDLSALTSLKTLLLTGSGITGVTFALALP